VPLTNEVNFCMHMQDVYALELATHLAEEFHGVAIYAGLSLPQLRYCQPSIGFLARDSAMGGPFLPL